MAMSCMTESSCQGTLSEPCWKNRAGLMKSSMKPRALMRLAPNFEPSEGRLLERLIMRTALGCYLRSCRSAQRFDGILTMETLCRLS